MSDRDTSYLRQREEVEREQARRAASPAAMKAHLALAEAYQRRLALAAQP